MEKVKVIIEWASDGTISAMMEKDMFAGMGDTVKAAVADMKEGVALYIKTAKEMGFPYKAYLDGAYEIELEYDAVSALKYAREYIKDTKLAELTGIPAASWDVMPMIKVNHARHNVVRLSRRCTNSRRRSIRLCCDELLLPVVIV